jgi:hypothetical protein
MDASMSSRLGKVVLDLSAAVAILGLLIVVVSWRDGVLGLIDGDPVVYVGPPVVLIAAAVHTGLRARTTARPGVRGAARALCGGALALAATHLGIVAWYQAVFSC